MGYDDLGRSFGNHPGRDIDERVADTVILLRQFTCVAFRIPNQFRIFISLKGFNVNHV